ncbi:MAG: response regulator transcription factor [Campylobacterota bacterium]|nr:response regulator transcription factor [Campylobacterota bacterium]
MINILMVEDDKELADIITRYLSTRDIKVTNLLNGLESINILSSNHNYDFMILDLTLPDIDGLELLLKIRKISKIPVIISSARDDLLDKIMGLERGADDYLPKPYDPRELEARIKTVLRRQEDSTQTDDTFKLDEDSHTIRFNNNQLDLTLAEFDILRTLLKNKNGVVSREQMIYDSTHIDDESSLKNIDVIISRIRQKIALFDNSKKYIHSVRGMGYKLIR